MRSLLSFRIAIQTMKDNFRISLIISFIFMGLVSMYSASFSAFKEYIDSFMVDIEGGGFEFFRGFESMNTYAGFVAVEAYEIFWILILGILIGFVAASLISREIEGKTIDLLMSNPVSRKQLVLEKYLGIIPFILLVNIATMLTVMGITVAIGEELNFGYLALTHAVSVIYFLTIASIGILISVIIDEKMKASIVTIAIVVGMFVFDSVSRLIPDYELLGSLSLTKYYVPTDILISGNVDVGGLVVMVIVTIICLFAALVYFDYRNIMVS